MNPNDQLVIPAGHRTPYIKFDMSSGIFEIKGSSLPENPQVFFQPVFEWMDENLEKNISPIAFECDFEHLNSVSNKYLLEIFRRTLKKNPKPEQVKVCWVCDEDDEDLRELGMDMKDILGIPFEFRS